MRRYYAADGFFSGAWQEGDASGEYHSHLLLGKVTGEDQLLLLERVSQLKPEQYRHLEAIVNNYIAALKETEGV